LDNGIPVEDALKFVSFAGRPANMACLQNKKVKPLPSPVVKVPSHKSETASHFISWVLKRAGLDPDSYRAVPLKRRLSACLRALHEDTEAGAIQLLEQKPELVSVAVGALIIGVTEFFRDPKVFETLRTQVLPQLAAGDRPLRVWSAGCSNGAELYSVAILLAQTGLLERSYLLGTDCRLDAIERSRNAVYDLSQLQMIKMQDQQTYFTREGSYYHPIEPLRRNIHWHAANIIQGIENGPWDLILWRNMAIYLTPEAAEPIWHGLASALAPGGALIVGRAERPPTSFSLINMCRCIYRSYSGDSHILGLQPKLKVQEMSI
jgi:chemotaxis protein methyltransferase CheR